MEGMEGRGSDRLAHLRKETLGQEHLDRLAGLADADGVRIVNWQPGALSIPNSISVRYLVDSARIAELIERLKHELLVQQIIVRPIGVPAREALHLEVVAG